MRVFEAQSPLKSLGKGYFAYPSGQKWFLTQATHKALLASKQRERETQRALSTAREVEIGEEAWQQARARLVLGISAKLSSPLPAAVVDEAVLKMYAQPGLRLEFVGRGRPIRAIDNTEALWNLDDPSHNRRSYYFRTVGDNEQNPTATDTFWKLQARVAHWLNDSDARVIISIGGGGYRVFACTPVLQLVEEMLPSRDSISEVWGCSGGTLAAHVFADGFDIRVLNDFAYQLYHGSQTVRDWSVGSVAKQHVRRMIGRHNELGGTIAGSWIKLLDKLNPPEERTAPRVPFFAVSCNQYDGKLYALADWDMQKDRYRDFLVPALRERALAASSAVPLLFPTQQLEMGEEGDEWVDGGLLDENPLALPFMKWCRDRRDAPDSTPKKLKIFMFDLNMRSSESPLVGALSRMPALVSSPVKLVSKQVDALLNSRSHLSLRLLGELPDVEVMQAKLTIGAFAVRDRPGILTALHRGRRLDAWKFFVQGAPA